MQVANSNPFYAAGAMFNAASNPVTATGVDANGNIEGVTDNGVNVFADPKGTIAGFSIADALTPADKAATGYDPSSGKINELAIAIANYHAGGFLKGDASPSLIDAVKKSLERTGGYPMNPNVLMAGSAPAPAFTYDTLSALLATQESHNPSS